MRQLKIEYRPLDDLIPYANNSRTHSEEQVAQIAASIREFGFTNPILIDEDGVIIAGHGRLMAARRLDMDKVPCIVLAGLTEAQKKALVIADNKIALNASWDEDLLQIELAALEELEFDTSGLGFDFEFDDVEIDEDYTPELPTGDREPIRNMTFTVSDEQHEIIEECLKKAQQFSPDDPMGVNENKNGNALYYICEFFRNGVTNG